VFKTTACNPSVWMAMTLLQPLFTPHFSLCPPGLVWFGHGSWFNMLHLRWEFSSGSKVKKSNVWCLLLCNALTVHAEARTICCLSHKSWTHLLCQKLAEFPVMDLSLYFTVLCLLDWWYLSSWISMLVKIGLCWYVAGLACRPV